MNIVLDLSGSFLDRFGSFLDRAIGSKSVASVGVEPTTFALLARRSNRLS